MKRRQVDSAPLCTLSLIVAMLVLCVANSAAIAGASDISTAPLITPGTTQVKPNLFFVLDNSGSMEWDYLPDYANDNLCKGTGSSTGASSACCLSSGGGGGGGGGTSSCLLGNNGTSSSRGLPPFHWAGFNNVYYDPTIAYTVPIDYQSNAKTSYAGTGNVPWDGYGTISTSNLAFTSAFPDIEWCTDSNYTDCLRNDNYILPGTVNGKSYTTSHSTTSTGTATLATGSVSSPTTTSRSVGPYYYVVIPAEYCTTKKLTDCQAATGPTSSRPFPTTLRWCSNSALTTCQAVKTSTFQYPRYPTIVTSSGTGARSATGKVTVSGVGQSSKSGTSASACSGGGASVVTITSIKFNGTETLGSGAGATLTYCSTSGTGSTRNNGLAALIQPAIGNGFVASVNNAVLTITAPNGASYNSASLTPSIATLTITTQFSGGADASGLVSVPGSFKRIDIISGQTYGNINDANNNVIVDRSNRTDCVARPTCTYAEELRNMANWFAWYRTRMQMTKSALSLAFGPIDTRFRVGMFTINNSSSNLVNIDDFGSTQKQTWYSTLANTDITGSTPLRTALSNAGRIFAGQTNVITGAKDPVQYSCQRNFAILSTDGYWNTGNGVQLSINGTAPTMGDWDSVLSRPQFDGHSESNTLADAAAYYYATDLRDASLNNCTNSNTTNGVTYPNLCVDNVPDANIKQHMVTYTIGLGNNGLMQYRSNYKNTPQSADLPDDYYDVAAGTTANPSQGVCEWQSTGACNWPATDRTSQGGQANIDDLWHAAINGYGTYLSARNPTQLNAGLNLILAELTMQLGSAAAATTSNPNVTSTNGDNFVFSSSYVTVDWTGELVRQQMDPNTAVISATIDWAAQAQLDSLALGSRNLWTFDFASSNGTNLKSFAWGSLNNSNATCAPPANEQGCFMSPFIDADLAQFCGTGVNCLAASQKTSASGQALVDFLRGDTSHQYDPQNLGNAANQWYRQRTHRLGDIVSSEGVFNGRYLFDYGTGNGYPAMNTAKANPTVYVAANDGMLHAFDSSSGQERWAYVPSMELPNLHKLANWNYSANHIFLVDGTPVVNDICTASCGTSAATWKTILVGGLASGGAGYYALDITDQLNPKLLWEFRQKGGCIAGTSPRYGTSGVVTTDCDLGFSFGNPVITKVNGTWSVVLTSGYNNNAPGNGLGYLYVLNAQSGSVISKTSTGVGDTTTPSGLGRLATWADDAMHDNTSKYAYAGDMLGNLWRFDLTVSSPTVTALIQLGATKPITARPELGLVVSATGTKKRAVFFPTGRLLGQSDVTDTSQQSFYGIWDFVGTGSTPSTIVSSPVSATSAGRTGTVLNSAFNSVSNLGWKIDFPGTGERGNTDPSLAFGTVIFVTNQPSTADACNPSGFSSYLYMVDYQSGGVVNLPGNTNTFIALSLAGATSRPDVVVLSSGAVKVLTRTTGAGGVSNAINDVRIGSGATSVRRVSWRELTN